MGKLQNLIGQKFGKLTVIERAENYVSPKGQQQTQWLCKCDCGNECVVWGTSLKNQLTTSCGCKGRGKKTHGYSKTRIYKIWRGMHDRCENPKHIKYALYGAEGKSVCEEWQAFEPFYEWAMNNGYNDNLTIERVDGNKGYSPDNCIWADEITQNNNTRRNHFITHNGKTQTMKQWSNETGIPYQTLAKRINEYHWSIEEALTK